MVFDQGDEWILSDGLPNTHVRQSIYRDIMKGLLSTIYNSSPTIYYSTRPHSLVQAFSAVSARDMR